MGTNTKDFPFSALFLRDEKHVSHGRAYLVIERGSARVVVDAVSLDLLSGSELDYTDELMGSHFAVRNPNATSACGCGTSFSVD